MNTRHETCSPLVGNGRTLSVTIYQRLLCRPHGRHRPAAAQQADRSSSSRELSRSSKDSEAGSGLFGICATVLWPFPGQYHNAGFMFSSFGLFGGNHVAVLPKLPTHWPRAGDDRSAPIRALVVLIPTMMSRIVRLREAERDRFDVSSLTHVWHTAAPCPPR